MTSPDATCERQRLSSARLAFLVFYGLLRCAMGAIAVVALLPVGKIQGERVGPNIEHRSK
jgi:hypothetical protein